MTESNQKVISDLVEVIRRQRQAMADAVATLSGYSPVRIGGKDSQIYRIERCAKDCNCDKCAATRILYSVAALAEPTEKP